MRLMPTSFIAACATLAVCTSPANACTCVDFSDYRNKYERATYVVYGIVAETKDAGVVPYEEATGKQEPMSLRATEVALDVKVQWKGEATDHLSFLSWCDVIFRRGAAYVVYAERRAGEHWEIPCGPTVGVDRYWLFFLTHPLLW